MATAQQLKALLQSYSEADGEMFVSVALQIAAHEARAGKGKLATEIKRLVDEIKGKQRSAKVGGSVPIARPTGELATLLSASYPRTRLSEMVLAPEQRATLELVIREYRQQGKLREHGLRARRKLLPVGAARSIRRRLEEFIAPTKVTPEGLLDMGADQLRSFGLSPQKTTYIRDLASKVHEGTVRLRTIGRLSDEAVIDHLIQVKGDWSLDGANVPDFYAGQARCVPRGRPGRSGCHPRSLWAGAIT